MGQEHKTTYNLNDEILKEKAYEAIRFGGAVLQAKLQQFETPNMDQLIEKALYQMDNDPEYGAKQLHQDLKSGEMNLVPINHKLDDIRDVFRKDDHVSVIDKYTIGMMVYLDQEFMNLSNQYDFEPVPNLVERARSIVEQGSENGFVILTSTVWAPQKDIVKGPGVKAVYEQLTDMIKGKQRRSGDRYFSSKVA